MASHCLWVLVWAGARYWHGVGGFVFNSPSSARHAAMAPWWPRPRARAAQPRKRNVFFVIASSPGTVYVGSCGIALNSTTRRHPWLGLVAGSRSPTQTHTRGLRHWAGEPAGHLGANSPSRRAAEHASAKRTKPPCPHWRRELSQAHHVNAVSRHRRVPPFASSRRPLTHALAHLQWQEPPRFIDASATSQASMKEPSPSRGPTTRPLRTSPRHP